MKRNIQHSTFNIQRRTLARQVLLGRWKLEVECSMFPLATMFLATALPLPGQTNTIVTNTPLTLLPPYGELPPSLSEQMQIVTAQHPISIMIAGLGIIALVAFGLWLLFRPKPKIIIPPEVQARLALEPLRQQPEDSAALSRVSQIVRNYFIAAFQLPPGELTTTEFSRALAGREEIGAELSSAATDFLRDGDSRKFSTQLASPPVAAVDQALQLVAQAEQRRAQLRQLSPTQTQGRRA